MTLCRVLKHLDTSLLLYMTLDGGAVGALEGDGDQLPAVRRAIAARAAQRYQSGNAQGTSETPAGQEA